jgi:ABC-2 type transport system permease protein
VTSARAPAAGAVPVRLQLRLLAERLLGDLLATPAAVAAGAAFAIGVVVVGDGLLGDSRLVDEVPGGDYLAFILPAGVLSAAVMAGTAGYMIVRDTEDRYFDRLLTMPVSRVAIVLAPMLVGGAYATLQGAVVLIAGAVLGATPATGIPGAAAMLLVALLWGMGVTGYMVAAALVTGDLQVTQVVELAFLPLLFLSPAVVPRDELSGWIDAIATVNPTTYAIEGMRTLMTEGWEASSLLTALAAVAAFAGVTTAAAAVAARRATARA